MTNYKPHRYSSFGGLEQLIPESATLITLHHWAAATGGRTFHHGTNDDYVVPTGKKFIATGVRFIVQAGAAAITMSIFSATAANATTGESDKVILLIPGIISGFLDMPITNSHSFASGTYVNYKTSSATLTPTIQLLIGYEVLN